MTPDKTSRGMRQANSPAARMNTEYGLPVLPADRRTVIHGIAIHPQTGGMACASGLSTVTS